MLPIGMPLNGQLCELGPDLIWRAYKTIYLASGYGPQIQPSLLSTCLHQCGVVSLSSPKKELVGKGRVC